MTTGAGGQTVQAGKGQLRARLWPRPAGMAEADIACGRCHGFYPRIHRITGYTARIQALMPFAARALPRSQPQSANRDLQ